MHKISNFMIRFDDFLNESSNSIILKPIRDSFFYEAKKNYFDEVVRILKENELVAEAFGVESTDTFSDSEYIVIESPDSVLKFRGCFSTNGYQLGIRLPRVESQEIWNLIYPEIKTSKMGTGNNLVTVIKTFKTFVKSEACRRVEKIYHDHRGEFLAKDLGLSFVN